MWSALFERLSPKGAGARLSTLIFHRVVPAPDPLFPGEVDAATFASICSWLAGWFRVLPLADAVRHLAEGTLPSRALSITFDDGYADNATVAMPILQRFGLPATFFVSTGFLDGGRMWNDTLIESVRGTALSATDVDPLGRLELVDVPARRRTIDRLVLHAKYLPPDERNAFVHHVAERLRSGLPADLMLSRLQVRALRAGGMDIGAHTITHPILASLSDEASLREIREGREQLEAIIDEPVHLFAYPNGKPGEDYEPRHVDLVRKCGFAGAMTTAWGAAGPHSDRFQLPRFTPWDRTRWRFGLRLARNLHA